MSLSPYVQQKLERLRGAATRARERAREVGLQAVHAAESMATAGAIGYLETKREAAGQQPLSVFGLDLEEAVALGGHAACLFGWVGGAEADHVRAAANGAAAVYGYKRGRELGQTAASRAALP